MINITKPPTHKSEKQTKGLAVIDTFQGDLIVQRDGKFRQLCFMLLCQPESTSFLIEDSCETNLQHCIWTGLWRPKTKFSIRFRWIVEHVAVMETKAARRRKGRVVVINILKGFKLGVIPKKVAEFFKIYIKNGKIEPLSEISNKQKLVILHIALTLNGRHGRRNTCTWNRNANPLVYI